SPGQPQESPHHASTTPALTMIRSRPRGRLVVLVRTGTLVVAWAGDALAGLMSKGVRERGVTTALHPHHCILRSAGPSHFRHAQYRKPPIKLCPQCSRL